MDEPRAAGRITTGLWPGFPSDLVSLFTVLAATGLTAQLGGQAFINILVNLQLFPSKGMTLPLISYGGSSTVALCLGVGFLLAITRRNPFIQREGLSLRDNGSVRDNGAKK